MRRNNLPDEQLQQQPQSIPVISIPNGPSEEDGHSIGSSTGDTAMKKLNNHTDKELICEKASTTPKKKKVVGDKKSAKKTGRKSSVMPQKAPETLCKLTVEDLTQDELQVIHAIGKIKKQKQRASFDRISHILKQSKADFPAFESADSLKQLLQSCLDRGLLQETFSDTGVLSYREMGPAAVIVAHIARRKNAASLAATYNVSVDLPSVETPIPAKGPVTPGRRHRPTRVPNHKNTVDAAVEQSFISESHTNSEPVALPARQPQPAVTVVKICGMCRADDSNDKTLITCSACPLSGKFP